MNRENEGGQLEFVLGASGMRGDKVGLRERNRSR